jgi:hypothetical protein
MEVGVGKIPQEDKCMINWDKEFAEARITSGPNSNGLIVSKIKPNGSNARSIWDDDKAEIMKAASKYHYKILYENSHVVSFHKKIEA